MNAPVARGNDFADREFPMSSKDFQEISRLADELAGIQLPDHKQEMVYGRLSRLIRKNGLNTFSEYINTIRNSPDTISEFINAITTNLTSFFREMHHFHYLHEVVYPELFEKNKSTKKLRIWSAGCSTGEEPYSLAISIKRFQKFANWDVKILATDLDSNVLATGKAGVYSADRIEELDDNLKKWFLRDKNERNPQVKVKSELGEMIRFNRLNLLEDWPMKGPFDIVFCRNVVIYFNKETQLHLFNRYADLIKLNQYLFIGHSETIRNLGHRLEPLGNTIYRKIS